MCGGWLLDRRTQGYERVRRGYARLCRSKQGHTRLCGRVRSAATALHSVQLWSFASIAGGNRDRLEIEMAHGAYELPAAIPYLRASRLYVKLACPCTLKYCNFNVFT